MIKTNAMRILETANIPFEVLLYEAKTALDGVTVAGKIGENPENVYKTLVAQGGPRDFYVFIIPVAEELDMKKAARAAGTKEITMLPLSKLTPVTGYVRGGCTAIGMKKDFPAFIDESAILLDHMVVSAGKIGMQLKLLPDDLLKAANAQYADLIK
ncbi:MAG: Cys-tRNA(Pro) deacylase [Clostridiales bacterium]|nr:Cys-tRNA(Pro) deacylase [Clostridiales bacterium]